MKYFNSENFPIYIICVVTLGSTMHGIIMALYTCNIVLRSHTNKDDATAGERGGMRQLVHSTEIYIAVHHK